ncbi:Acyl-CoA thioester hydrolase [Candidatus Terasakiella magnetica]|uniref:Acyl-CoA thioester hydrolase n=1 Tax=Candidatus Terasakiella magnetica TaxID=1867952 RepID=A0A1C3RD78_9PROT|nr:thioesterase family protein [Candidatus Terasakiella magnetica]SCA55250.1 Acyl-CoA thioester hydrolase [Candidatus Terasakiella magnetica]
MTQQNKAILTHRSTVQQWECDHMGHLNVRNYMAKFDDAAWSFLAVLGINKAYFSERNGGVAAVDHHVTYQQELLPGDCVEIHSRLALFEGKKFKMVHVMSNAVTGAKVSQCELFGVHMDQKERRAVNFPDDILANAQPYLTSAQDVAAQ